MRPSIAMHLQVKLQRWNVSALAQIYACMVMWGIIVVVGLVINIDLFKDNEDVQYGDPRSTPQLQLEAHLKTYLRHKHKYSQVRSK